MPPRPLFALLKKYGVANTKDEREEVATLKEALQSKLREDPTQIDLLFESLTKKLTLKQQEDVVVDLMVNVLFPLTKDDPELAAKAATAASKQDKTFLHDSFVHVAACFPKVMKRVLEMKPRPSFSQKNVYGETVLHIMAPICTLEIKPLLKSLLLIEGIEVDAVTAQPRFYTPLYLACNAGKLEAVKVLCPFGLNKPVHDGLTPLMAASRAGHKDIVEYLISQHADKNKQNRNGKTAWDLASPEIREKFLRSLRPTSETLRLSEAQNEVSKQLTETQNRLGIYVTKARFQLAVV